MVSRRPDGFYWFYLTDNHRIKNGRLNGSHPSLEAAAASAVAPNLNLQDIDLALEALAARGELESCVGPDGVRQYWLPDDAADTGIGRRSASLEVDDSRRRGIGTYHKTPVADPSYPQLA
jgi:hypothetical protein